MKMGTKQIDSIRNESSTLTCVKALPLRFNNVANSISLLLARNCWPNDSPIRSPNCSVGLHSKGFQEHGYSNFNRLGYLKTKGFKVKYKTEKIPLPIPPYWIPRVAWNDSHPQFPLSALCIARHPGCWLKSDKKLHRLHLKISIIQ